MIARLNARYGRLKGFLDQCYIDKLEGVITSENWEARSKDWRAEQADIEKRLQSVRKADTKTMLEGVRIMEEVRNA